MNQRSFAWSFVLLLSGCNAIIGEAIPGGGNVGGADGGGLGGGDGGPSVDGGPVCIASRNDEIRQRMAPACERCHGAGATKPFFASLDAFESLLVQNPRYIVHGDPDRSLFIKLLEGQGTGTFTQMPLGETYAALVTAGRVNLDLPELRAWVTALSAASVSREPDPEAIATRRLTAEEISDSLMTQLGLTRLDFGRKTGDSWFMESAALGLFPPNEIGGFTPQYNNDYAAAARFEALGGPNTMAYRARDKVLSTSALQVLVQVSQAWCRRAVKKAGNTAVLSEVTLADRSATASDKIKRNIAALHLRMLGEPAQPADVEAIYQDVYLPYEPGGTDVAWTAVCAAFVRDPSWILF